MQRNSSLSVPVAVSDAVAVPVRGQGASTRLGSRDIWVSARSADGRGVVGTDSNFRPAFGGFQAKVSRDGKAIGHAKHAQGIASAAIGWGGINWKTLAGVSNGKPPDNTLRLGSEPEWRWFDRCRVCLVHRVKGDPPWPGPGLDREASVAVERASDL